MITGKKLQALLDQADKTDRDLIRYVCNGLQAYTVNQTPIDPIWLLLSGLREEIIKPRLPASGHHYGNISPSSSLARDYRNDLKKLSLKNPRTFDDIRNTLIPRDMDLLGRFLIDKYYERQDVEPYIRNETPGNVEAKQESIMTQACNGGAGWCYGKKDICDYLKISWTTVKRHKYPLLVEEGSNRPMQSKQALDTYRLARSRKKKK